MTKVRQRAFDGRGAFKNQMKPGSLAFLASGDTNNVLNGEGLVSLAWAMMGSGATIVVSAQCEANDKSTEIFSKSFYGYYKQGSQSAGALQKSSLEMIYTRTLLLGEFYVKWRLPLKWLFS